MERRNTSIQINWNIDIVFHISVGDVSQDNIVPSRESWKLEQNTDKIFVKKKFE
jgi:hypothetical protein